MRVALESCNFSSVKDHIIRIRSLFNDGNCPHLKSLIMGDEDENEVIEEEVTEEKKEKKTLVQMFIMLRPSSYYINRSTTAIVHIRY